MLVMLMGHPISGLVEEERGILTGFLRKLITGPRWTWDEKFEKPADEVNMGSYTIQVYSLEQQQQLGVDSSGNTDTQPADVTYADNSNPDINPMCRDKIQKLCGSCEADITCWHECVVQYIEELKGWGCRPSIANMPSPTPSPSLSPVMERLERLRQQMRQTRIQRQQQHHPKKRSSSRGLTGEHTKSRIGPRWTWDASFEKPQATKSMGTWNAQIYTTEQQQRLHVNEWGIPDTEEVLRYL